MVLGATRARARPLQLRFVDRDKQPFASCTVTNVLGGLRVGLEGLPGNHLQQRSRRFTHSEDSIRKGAEQPIIRTQLSGST